MAWTEAADFANDHLAPTALGNIEIGINKITGSIIDTGNFDSDTFVLFNPNEYLIESISVTVTSFVDPTYPPFDPNDPLVGQLPGVILIQPNHAGSIPFENGNYFLSSDYDESGNLSLADSSELTFSVFYDSRPELLAPGGFDYEISVLATVPEPSYLYFGFIIGIITIFRRKTRTSRSYQCLSLVPRYSHHSALRYRRK